MSFDYINSCLNSLSYDLMRQKINAVSAEIKAFGNSTLMEVENSNPKKRGNNEKLSADTFEKVIEEPPKKKETIWQKIKNIFKKNK